MNPHQTSYRSWSKELHNEKCFNATTDLQFKSKNIHHNMLLLNHPRFPEFYYRHFERDRVIDNIRLTWNKELARKVLGEFKLHTQLDLRNYFYDGKNQRNLTPERILLGFILQEHHLLLSRYSNFAKLLSSFADQNSKQELTVILEEDIQSRFLRLFIGFPIAKHVGRLTLPIVAVDGTFH